MYMLTCSDNYGDYVIRSYGVMTHDRAVQVAVQLNKRLRVFGLSSRYDITLVLDI